MDSDNHNYFYRGICLFCEQKAGEKFFGNHGRDSVDICKCSERAAWNKAKAQVQLTEEDASSRLKIRLLELENKKSAEALKNNQQKINELNSKINRLKLFTLEE